MEQMKVPGPWSLGPLVPWSLVPGPWKTMELSMFQRFHRLRIQNPKTAFPNKHKKMTDMTTKIHIQYTHTYLIHVIIIILVFEGGVSTKKKGGWAVSTKKKGPSFTPPMVYLSSK